MEKHLFCMIAVLSAASTAFGQQYRGNSELHIKMRDMGIPHEYRVREGAHVWEYWRTGLPEGLKFISKSFHR